MTTMPSLARVAAQTGLSTSEIIAQIKRRRARTKSSLPTAARWVMTRLLKGARG